MTEDMLTTENVSAEPTTPDEETDTAPEDVTSADAPTADTEDAPTPFDPAELAAADLVEIKRLAPCYAEAEDLRELPFAHRFAELRELGLSVGEALAAVTPRFEKENGKAHLRPGVGVGRSRPAGTMSAEEMAEARALFRDLDERAIHALYRKVTGR